MEQIGRMIFVAGIALAVFGAVIWLIGPRVGAHGGLLPGDIHVQRGHFAFYFPIVTCIAVSLLLSVLFRLFNR